MSTDPFRHDQVLPTAHEASGKTLAMICYALLGLGYFNGITAVVALVIAYVKRGDYTHTFVESHFSWQIRTFWWALGIGVLAFILTFIFIGVFVYLGLGVWVIYRLVKGFLRLNDLRPVA